MTVYLQRQNWRTLELRLRNADGSYINLTGATGYVVWTSPAGVSHRVAITLGRAGSATPAADAILGWCYATSTEITSEGTWSEQVQLTLPTGSEPLYGGVVQFGADPNLIFP